MTQLAPEPHVANPSRPPPGLAFPKPELKHHHEEVGHPPPVTSLPPKPRTSSWPRAAALVTVVSLASVLVAQYFGDGPQAIERSSKPAPAAEVRTLESGVMQRWLATEVNVVIDSSVRSITPGAEQAVLQSFGAWLASNPNLPALTIANGHGLTPKLDPDGVNAIMYGPIEFPGHEDDLAITIGFSDEHTGEITEADIIINSRHNYADLDVDTPGAPTLSCDGSSHANVCDFRYDLQNVMAHEVGHFYGLGEDREDRASTMYSCTSACETHKRDLSESDRNAINTLYYDGFAANQSVGCGGAQIAPRGKLWLGAGVLALGLFALVRRVRRVVPRATNS